MGGVEFSNPTTIDQGQLAASSTTTINVDSNKVQVLSGCLMYTDSNQRDFIIVFKDNTTFYSAGGTNFTANISNGVITFSNTNVTFFINYICIEFEANII